MAIRCKSCKSLFGVESIQQGSLSTPARVAPDVVEFSDEQSRHWSPAFCIVDGVSVNGFQALGVRWGQDLRIIPDAAEREVGRWLATLSAGYSDDPDQHGARPTEAFVGNGRTELTTKRLVGILLKAESVIGDVDIDRSSAVLAIRLALEDVTEVKLVTHDNSAVIVIWTNSGGALTIANPEAWDEGTRQSAPEAVELLLETVVAVKSPETQLSMSRDGDSMIARFRP